MPPESIMPIELKPHACHSPRTPGCGPTRGLWSGVNASGPQTVDAIPTDSIGGQRWMWPCPGDDRGQSGGQSVNLRVHAHYLGAGSGG